MKQYATGSQLPMVSLILIGTLLLPWHIQAQPTSTTDRFSRPPDILGPNSRGWFSGVSTQSFVTLSADQPARWKPRVPTVEWASGMNFRDPVSGKWTPSVPIFTLNQAGDAFVADRVQHPTRLTAKNLNVQGAVSIGTPPDGEPLSLTPLAIGLYDRRSGQSLILATLTNTPGTLVQSNVVLFEDALAGACCASVYYVIERGSISQDVLFTGRFSAEEFNFPRDSTLVQIISEIYQAPAAEIIDRPFYVEQDKTARSTAVMPDLVDRTISFSGLCFGPGFAYTTPSDQATNGTMAPVMKEIRIIDSRMFLVESVEYSAIAEALAALPDCAAAGGGHASLNRGLNMRNYASLPVPPGPAQASARTSTSTQLASASKLPSGLVIDFVATVTGSPTGNPIVFQSATNWFISGPVYCNQPTIIEGGTIFKYKTNAFIQLNNTLTLKTSTYRPAVFSGVDDDSIGDSLTNWPGASYTGTINPNGYANPAFLVTQPSTTFSNCRFRYAKAAVMSTDPRRQTITVNHSQFWNCVQGVSLSAQAGSGTGLLVSVNNSLMANVQYPFIFPTTNLQASSCNVINSTFDHATQLLSGSAGTITVNSRNSVFANIGALGMDISGTCNGFFISPVFGTSIYTNNTSPFQLVGAGAYYLTDASGFRNKGTVTSVPADLLADLSERTTYPPILVANTNLSTVNTNLYPQIWRDTDTVDLGYHYPAVDYEFSAVRVTNAITVLVNPGTVIAFYDTNYLSSCGLWLANGARLITEGTPLNMSRLVEYNTVQEQTYTNWGPPGHMMVTDQFVGATAPAAMNFHFTDWSTLGLDDYPLYVNYVMANLKDCQVHGGLFGIAPSTANLTNCLFERVYSALYPWDGNTPHIRNSTFIGGIFEFSPGVNNSDIKDNLFDRTTIDVDLSSIGYDGGYNAFVTNCTRLNPAKTGDIILTNSPSYQAGPLGSYYHPTNSLLINAGSTGAQNVGLYHYTILTNLISGLQIKETNSVVDIGFHYVALDSCTNLIDTDGGGAPDYFENASGDGTTNHTGETNWQDPSDDYKDLLAPGYLRCEYRENPLGIETRYGQPRLYWIVTSPRRAEKQVAYQVLVASSPDKLTENSVDVWNSGKVYSDQTIHVEYDNVRGQALQSGQRLYWKVRSWDLYTGLSAWSTNGAMFQMGLLSTNDWAGRWLTTANDPGVAASPIYRREFQQRTNDIKRGTVYVSAKGVYELWINGERIGTNILAPEWTDYNQRLQYQTFDVTANLLSTNTDGTNHVIGGIVAEGWFSGSAGQGDIPSPPPRYTNYNRAAGFGNKQILVQLNIDRTDGSTASFLSDSNWTCSLDGPIRQSSIEAGETYAATNELKVANWSKYGGTANSFTTPIATEALYATQLVAQPTDPIQVVGTRAPVDMWTNRTGGPNFDKFVRVYDMGQNMEGWCSITLPRFEHPDGTAIHLRHCECLQLNSNNQQVRGTNVDDHTLYSGAPALQIETYYALNSSTAKTYQPHFTYHSFRFVEVDAPEDVPLSTNSILGYVMRSAVPETGSFTCSQQDINQLMTNITWTLRANLYGIYTACADRSERYGWFVDTDVFSQTACFLADMGAMYTKIIRDSRDDQYPDTTNQGLFYYGAYMVNNPWAGKGIGDISAMTGGIIKPWHLYQNYGDVRMLKEHYLSASNWVNWLSTVWSQKVEANWENYAFCTDGDTFGSVPYSWPAGYARMSDGVLATCHYAHSADILAGMSKSLETESIVRGNYADALLYRDRFQTYTNLAFTVRSNFQRSATGPAPGFVYYDGNGNITKIGNTGAQGDYVQALYFNMVPDDQRGNCMNLLLNDSTKGISKYNKNYIASNVNHFSTGIFGTGRGMLELTRNGALGTAYDVLLNYQFPSWFYQITNGAAIYSGANGGAGAYGATTIWERWNGWVSGANNGISGYAPPYSSFNQVWNGSVGEWIYRNIAGINPDEAFPSFKKVVIWPRPSSGVTSASATFNSIRGCILSSWTSNSTFNLNVTIPANVTASVYLPGTDLTKVIESGRAATNAVGVTSCTVTNGFSLLEIGSGSYNFSLSF